MPSQLRLQSSFEPITVDATYQTSPTLPPAKKQKKMSLTQTYFVASTARSKLGREASKADHNLRRLVGHANLLDQLMVDLADAEREQEAWFNQSVKKASKPEEPRHIQWVDTIPEADEEEEEEEEDGSDSDSEYDEDMEMFDIPLRKIRSPPVTVSSAEIEEGEEEYDEDDEYDQDHALMRVASHSHSPPMLIQDEDSDEEDQSMPPSPDMDMTIEFSEKEREAIATTNFYDVKSQRGLEDYIMQQAQQPQAPVIAAY